MPGPGEAGAPAGIRLVIDATDIPEPSLEATIKDRLAAKQDLVVEVRGSRDLSYGAVARVIRACKAAGVVSVRLATERAGLTAGGLP